jgi:hypothetical protein
MQSSMLLENFVGIMSLVGINEVNKVTAAVIGEP